MVHDLQTQRAMFTASVVILDNRVPVCNNLSPNTVVYLSNPNTIGLVSEVTLSECSMASINRGQVHTTKKSAFACTAIMLGDYEEAKL